MKIENILVSLTVFLVAVFGIYGTGDVYPVALHKSYLTSDELSPGLEQFHIE